MENLIQEIKDISSEISKEVIGFRRHIHQNPELAFNEFQTAKFIREVLSNNNIEFDNSFGENAVIGIINGKNNGETIALRADIDALPIIEENQIEFSSANRGVMHACGHDAHTASLLGTAIILKKLAHYINGRIILVFQPAEEKIPGGAKILIEKGLISKYDIKKIIGQHVLPEMATGNFCFGSGSLMASTDELYINFTGVGGHAALPKKRSDTVLALVEFLHEVMEMQKSLVCDFPFIVTFGKIVADGAINIIPSKVSAEGTMRTFNEKLRADIKIKLKESADNNAEKFKCTANLEIRHGYPSLFNDIELTEEVVKAAKEFLPIENIENMELRMTAEDFAYYSKEIPAVFYRMGIDGNGLGKIGLHNPNFNLDENALVHSVGLMAFIALRINN
jgi:amidohydrolase